MAILLVVLHHLGLRVPLRDTVLGGWLPPRLLDAMNDNGYEAVFVFFVISGFLIAVNALDRWGDLARIEPATFYRRRGARILPCLLALVAVLALLHSLGVPDYAISRPGQSLGGAVAAALGLYLNWYEGQTGYLPGNWDVLWSLSIEEVFYLGFPLVCLLARRRAVLVPLLVLLALSLPWSLASIVGNEVWKEKAYLPGMAAIATGILGALWLRAKPPGPRDARVLRWFGGAAMLAVMTLMVPWLWRALHDGVLLMLTVATMCLLVGMGRSAPSTGRARGLGWLESWGQLSYEIYLTHMFVVFAALHVWHRWRAGPGAALMLYAAVLPVCWLLGWAVARGFSQPCECALRARPAAM
ncbi:acyltransferase family protein [Dyella sp.]|jgi:peptidoglycan/LPS O-acetylase OafA/YrhL|uniref:acyltransferase family protein n=1 Tax=Dyella sp. TaxID=1869338 RepID=UPI0039C89368